MKRIYSIILFVLCANISIFAAGNEGKGYTKVEDLFVNIPDTLLPYATPDQREELIHMAKETPGDTAKVAHALGSYMRLLEAKANYLRLDITETSTLQIAVSEAHNRIILIYTNSAPEAESIIKAYDMEWNFIKSVDLGLTPEMFLKDSLTESEKQETLDSIEFPLYSATLTNVTDEELSLSVNLAIPMLSTEEKSKINERFYQKNVNLSIKSLN